MTPTEPGQIITFYSYKGGTGRSMALANVAYILGGMVPENGPGILMIDWDLEAPGLHRFFSGASQAPADGLIEFFEAADQQYRSAAPASRGDAVDSFATLRHDVIATFSKHEGRTGVPNLTLVRAGRLDDHYPEKVRKFDWEGFHRRDPRFFIDFRKYLASRYSVVLIDSRTGLTDTSGICARQMPDKLVLVFVPNHQNIDGVLDVARKVRDFRISDSTDTRPLSIFPLASRIDATASRRLNIWRRGGAFDDQPVKGYQVAFEELLAELYELDECHLDAYFDATQVNHDSDYAFGESIAARHGTTDRLTLGIAYANFARRITTLFGPWELLSEERVVAEARLKEAAAEARAASAQSIATRTRRWGLLFGAAAAVVVLISLGVGLYYARSSSQAEAELPLTVVRASEDPLEQALVLAAQDPEREPSESAVAFARTVAREPLPVAMLKGHTGRILQVQFDLASEQVLTLSSAAAIVQKADGTGAQIVVSPGEARASLVSAGFDARTRRLMTLAYVTDDQRPRATGKPGIGNPLLQMWDITQAAKPVRIQQTRNVDIAPPVGFIEGLPFVVTGSYSSPSFSEWQEDGWDYYFSPATGFDARQGTLATAGGLVAIPGKTRVRGEFPLERASKVRRIPTVDASAWFVGYWTFEVSGESSTKYGEVGPLSSNVFALSVNGQYLATGSAEVWEVAKERRIREASVQPVGGEDSFAISSNARWFASSSVARATLVPLETKGGSLTLRGHRAPIVTIAFSPDSRLLATGAADGEVRVWRIESDLPPDMATWADLVRYFRGATTACLTADQHVRLLGAVAAAAQAEVDKCELANQRTSRPNVPSEPPPASATAN